MDCLLWYNPAHRGMKGGGRFIQEVGTFWCIHCNTEPHRHLTPLTCTASGNNYTRVWLDLPAPSWTLPTFFFMRLLQGAVVTLTQWLWGEWCVISQRGNTTLLVWNKTSQMHIKQISLRCTQWRKKKKKREIDWIRYQMTHRGICQDMMSVWIIEHLGRARQSFHVRTAKQTVDDAMFDFHTSGGCQDSTCNIKQCRVGVSTGLN